MNSTYLICMDTKHVATFYGSFKGALETLEAMRYADFCNVKEKFAIDYSEYVKRFNWVVVRGYDRKSAPSPHPAPRPAPSINEMQFVDQLWRVGQNIVSINKQNGWDVAAPDDWKNKQKLMAVLMLINTELAEAAEALRNDDRANFEEELADVFIRLLDLAYGMDLDLAQNVLEKMVENSNRGHKHGGKTI